LVVVSFIIDVSGSSGALTSDGQDFSRFSFTPNSSLLTQWTTISSDFDSFGTVFYDTNPTPGPIGSLPDLSTFNPLPSLPSGADPYRLGTLSVNLDKVDVSGPSPLVSIEGPFAMIGVQDPVDYTTIHGPDYQGTFRFSPVTFDVSTQPLFPVTQAVPEPA